MRLTVHTGAQTELIDITAPIERTVAASGVRQGLCLVYVPHTTAGVMINEHADPDVVEDVGRVLDRLAPWEDRTYRHAEGNTAAHVKAIMVGSSARVIVQGGRLRLGTWQGVFFCEFDGPRRDRKVVCTLIGNRE